MIRYTVFLVEQLEEAQQAIVMAKLQKIFHMTKYQAEVMAKKPRGHILKPTTHHNASQVSQLYLALRLKVEIIELEVEDVAEEHKESVLPTYTSGNTSPLEWMRSSFNNTLERMRFRR
jgi:hypothetical protein